MRWLLAIALLPACYVEGRGQISRTYGGGGGGFGFALTNAHQDGELGMEVASSRTRPTPGESAAPTLIDFDARYAHAIDPRGRVRLYVRGGVGTETCPSTLEAQRRDGCEPTAAHSSTLDGPLGNTWMTEVAAGVSFTLADRDDRARGASNWRLGALDVGVVYSKSDTLERGAADFLGIDLALRLGFDPTTFDDRKHD